MNVRPGDLAVVKKSVDGAAVGMIVQVIEHWGVHSVHGDIWRCRSKSNIVTEYGGVGQEAGFADDWLQRIMPPTLNDIVKQKELENE